MPWIAWLLAAAALGVGYWALGGVAPRESQAAIEKVRFACIGVGGKGASDSADAGRTGDVVAICDIDDERLAAASEKWPNAKKYHDFRKMYDEMASGIDDVNHASLLLIASSSLAVQIVQIERHARTQRKAVQCRHS